VLVRRLVGGLIVLMCLAVPAGASAFIPPVENLAPPPGSGIQGQEHQDIYVEFACPTYGGSKFYWVQFGSNGEPNPEGKIATPFRITSSNGTPINAGEDICHANLPWYIWENKPSGTAYYWQVERRNCSTTELLTGEACPELGPIWSFTVAVPPKPAPPKTSFPSGPIPEEPTEPTATPHQRPLKIEAWTGCGLARGTQRSSSCRVGSPVGAFIEASRSVDYTLCIVFPSSREECVRDQHAVAHTSYVNKLTADYQGRYELTWEAEGIDATRILHLLPPERHAHASTRQNRACGNVKTRFLLAWSVESTPGFACSGAQKVIRKYFERVVETGQVLGGCAAKRSHKGCKIGGYRCFTRLSREASQLEGECRGRKGRVYFNENDRGPE